MDRGLAVLLLDAVIRECFKRLPICSTDGMLEAANAALSGDGIRMRTLIKTLRKKSDQANRDTMPEKQTAQENPLRSGSQPDMRNA